MSISVYGRINRKCIDEYLLEQLLNGYFLPNDNIVKKNNKEYVSYEGIFDNNKVIIYFVSDKKYPYNIYESNIINDKFEYEQLIIFDIEKEYATVDIYTKIINFCIYLNRKIKCDLLVTSDVHDEICLLKKQNIIWSQNVYFVL